MSAWLAIAAIFASASTVEGRRIEFRLKEAAGLRRFGYPVHVTLPFDFTPAGLDDDGFVLERDGREIPAQFRRNEQPDGASVVSLDFNASPGAFEVLNYAVHHDPGRRPSMVKDRGIGVRRNGSTIEVSHSPHITYAFRDDLAGFVSSVKIPSAEFIKKEDSSGLFVVIDGQKTPLRSPNSKSAPGPRVRIGRQGPLAIGLQSEHQIRPDGSAPVASVIDMTFPSSKSWIETSWKLNDPENRVEVMGLDLEFLLDDPPILLDCGAKSTVYATLKEREMVSFEAGILPSTTSMMRGWTPGWVIRHGSPEKSEVLATARRSVENEPEGWMHVIDERRCTAMAVADFGYPAILRDPRRRVTLDRFEIHGNGRFRFERRFLTEKNGREIPKNPIKTLRFWLHFVTTPVQVGAVTSPQSMMAPLTVEWGRP